MPTKPTDQWAARKLTKRVVDALPNPPKGQQFVRDTELKGFALRLTAGGARAWIIEKRIQGKTRRFTLGRYPDLTAEKARATALAQLGEIAGGADPVAEKQAARIRGVTLHEAFKEFRQVRTLKPKTLYDYQRVMEVAFGDWQAKPLREISKDMVARRHRHLGESRGPAYANGAMRVLRSVINYAMARYEDRDGNPIIADNPVMRLTRTRSWYRVGRRRTVIKPHQLPAWYRGVLTLKADISTPQAETVADYLLLLLFTGLRRSEAAGLRWEDVDLLGRTLTIPQTKNGEPLVLPLSDFLCELLEARRLEAQTDYVFPGHGHPGALVEPRRPIARVIEQSGVAFTIHDLRRTFITVAESLDISAYALKRLVNHKMHNDVTAGYIISDVERLRKPMQQVTEHLLRLAGATDAQILPFPNPAASTEPA